MSKEISTVILAGGLGLRMRGYKKNVPKALVGIGGIALIHHVMNIYSSQGFNKFVVCLGYKGDQIKDYFSEMKKGPLEKNLKKLEIDFVETGLETQTGGRIKKVQNYIDSENFFVTYCDGLSDINLQKLKAYHLEKSKVATLTAVNPMSNFGIIEIEKGYVKSFKEKPKMVDYVNGGFFIFNTKIFDYLDEEVRLEDKPLKRLSYEKELMAYKHDGFWGCADTPKDVDQLNKMWEGKTTLDSGIKIRKSPWKTW